MISIGSVRIVAVLAALMLGSSANAFAQDARKEVRQTLQGDCQNYTGKDRGTCMRHAARTMRDIGREARSEYKSCLDQGYSRAECNEEQEDFWNRVLVF